MVNIRCATLKDVGPIVQFGIQFKQEQSILEEIQVNAKDTAIWFANCIATPGTCVFVAEDEAGICGFIVLTEMACPWNNSHRYLADLLFLARKGGIKLIKAAKTLAKKRNYSKVVLSTSSKRERSDKFFNHIGQKLGEVYEIEV